MFKKLFAIALVMSLTACGTLVGAGAGGYAGNQFGSGSRKAAATAAGVVGAAYWVTPLLATNIRSNPLDEFAGLAEQFAETPTLRDSVRRVAPMT